MTLPNAPIAEEGFFVTHFLTVADQARSIEFYVGVLGGRTVKKAEPQLCQAGEFVDHSQQWWRANTRQAGSHSSPPNLNRVSCFLNLRVADIWACYSEWKAKGAEFLTERLDNHGEELRCYMRDPDGYIIEVGQYSPAAIEDFKRYLANKK